MKNKLTHLIILSLISLTVVFSTLSTADAAWRSRITSGYGTSSASGYRQYQASTDVIVEDPAMCKNDYNRALKRCAQNYKRCARVARRYKKWGGSVISRFCKSRYRGCINYARENRGFCLCAADPKCDAVEH